MRLIDADALINDAMDRYCKDCDKRKGIKRGKWIIIYEIGDVPCRACDVDDMVNDIESAPTITPDMAQVLAYECGKAVRKRGEWIEENRRPKSMMFYCSECHRTAYDPQNHHSGRKRCRYAFCPNCGADMRKGEEE